MRLTTRFYCAIVAFLIGTFLALLATATSRLEDTARRDAAFQLEQTARLATRFLAERPFDDVLADSLGAGLDLRVTLIGRDGRVLGDSDVPASRLPSVENHADRPEVAAALDGRIGVAERASETVARSLLYVAVPADAGAIRFSARLDPVVADVERLRQSMLIVLVVALALAYPASHLLARPVLGRIRRARTVISGMADGDFGSRTRLMGDDAVGQLGHAIDGLADSLAEQVGRTAERTHDLRALFDGLEDGVAFVDADGSLQIRNPAFERWVGRPVDPGTRMSGLFRSPEVLAAVDRAQRGEPVAEEVRIGESTVLMSAHPHRGGAILIVRDLTKLRRLEGVRRDFVANVSHELKTPLTSIVGFAEAISGGDVAAGMAADFGGRILANATRMRRLVDDLLDLALIESGSWQPSLETASIGEAAREVWDALGGTDRGVILEVEEAAECRAQADAGALRQILRNLLENALHYAPRGSTVRVRVRPAAGLVRAEVRDEGPGIPAAHVPRVFERFYRVDPGRSRELGGTGLGLAIVKHLVVAHGGDVGLDSAVSSGTTVWFSLPMRDEDPAG